MRLRYFSTNASWGFVFGADTRIAEVIRLEGKPILFESRAEGIAAAEERNLTVDGSGNVRPFWATGPISMPKRIQREKVLTKDRA